MVGLCQTGTLWRDISIMKGVERCAQFLKKFECYSCAITCIFNGGRAVVPRADGCTGPEWITQNIPEGMPVGDRKAQMFRHRPVLDHSGGVVLLESQRVFGRWPFVSDSADFRK